MRIYFVTDIHGSEICFRKFLNAAEFYEADVLILGGDICGKYIVPYYRRKDAYMIQQEGGEKSVPPEQLPSVLQSIRDAGGYPHEIEPDQLAELRKDGQALDDLFEELSVRSIERWLAIAEERLNGSDVRCLISPGNDDPPRIDELLDSSSRVENPEEQAADLGTGVTMVSCGVANRTPWDSPREADEDELAALLEQRIAMAPDVSRCVFNFHVPPYETPLDVAPLLDENLKPVVRSGEIVTTHVGSSAVREAVEGHGPLLALHGHIHESRATCRLGGSLCINPGSEYGQGALLGALVQIGRRGTKVKGYQLTQG